MYSVPCTHGASPYSQDNTTFDNHYSSRVSLSHETDLNESCRDHQVALAYRMYNEGFYYNTTEEHKSINVCE